MKRLLPAIGAICLGALVLTPVLAKPPIPPKTQAWTYTAWAGVHYKSTKSYRVTVEMVSGGGGGMGSMSNMEFGDGNPIPYHLYGGMATESCFDALPAVPVVLNGSQVIWPNHGLTASWPLLVSGIPDAHYVIGETINAASFKVSDKPYNAPGLPAFPQNPSNWNYNGVYTATPYRYCVLGASGGGIIGDQGLTGSPVGFSFAERNWEFIAGDNGTCTLGGGGRGGGGGRYGGGAIEQFGTLHGNRGNDLSGGGGSGGGMGDNYRQIGPCGGGGGSYARIHADIKASYYIRAGAGGVGGIAGPGGYAGGPGGNGSVTITEEMLP